jgi:hypothetical protein
MKASPARHPAVLQVHHRTILASPPLHRPRALKKMTLLPKPMKRRNPKATTIVSRRRSPKLLLIVSRSPPRQS